MADLIEWLAVQPWSNAKVGVAGYSYGAILAYLAAAQRPPHLRAVAARAAYSSAYRDIVYLGGVRGLDVMAWELGLATNSTMAADAYQHPLDDEFWRERAIDAKWPALRASKLPILDYGGWYDIYQDAEPRNYEALRAQTWLVMGPGAHLDASPVPDGSLLAWFEPLARAPGRAAARRAGHQLRDADAQRRRGPRLDGLPGLAAARDASRAPALHRRAHAGVARRRRRPRQLPGQPFRRRGDVLEPRLLGGRRLRRPAGPGHATAHLHDGAASARPRRGRAGRDGAAGRAERHRRQSRRAPHRRRPERRVHPRGDRLAEGRPPPRRHEPSRRSSRARPTTSTSTSGRPTGASPRATACA